MVSKVPSWIHQLELLELSSNSRGGTDVVCSGSDDLLEGIVRVVSSLEPSLVVSKVLSLREVR